MGWVRLTFSAITIKRKKTHGKKKNYIKMWDSEKIEGMFYLLNENMNEMKAKLDNFFMEMIALKQENEQVKTNYNIGEQNN